MIEDNNKKQEESGGKSDILKNVTIIHGLKDIIKEYDEAKKEKNTLKDYFNSGDSSGSTMTFEGSMTAISPGPTPYLFYKYQKPASVEKRVILDESENENEESQDAAPEPDISLASCTIL